MRMDHRSGPPWVHRVAKQGVLGEGTPGWIVKKQRVGVSGTEGSGHREEHGQGAEGARSTVRLEMVLMRQAASLSPRPGTKEARRTHDLEKEACFLRDF